MPKFPLMSSKAKLSFLGAAKNVTGSCYLLEAERAKILVDCGYYQERKLKGRNWEPFAFAPADIDAVLLTHAHLDHCGLLPKLVRDGFKGKIFCTPATADIAKIILMDSARIQEEDVKYKKKRHKKEGRKGPHPLVPLYTVPDAEATFPLFHPVEYGSTVVPAPGVEADLRDIGHILGSSAVKIKVGDSDSAFTIGFSGDVGRWDVPILRDPNHFDALDYVVVESTYGNRVHKDNSMIPAKIESIVNDTCKAGGNVVIPSFAVERTQELLYHLHELLRADRIPHVPVFVDSPMAIRVTDVFRRHPELFDEETVAMLERGEHPCDFPKLVMAKTVDQSKAIKNQKGGAIIIAGSGMCTGGRIKHHLKDNIERPESTILFVGYQANGTLGRRLIEGDDEVRIHGRMFNVEAQIEKVNGFSAHADRNELLKWLRGLNSAPRKVFVTHGEPEAAESFTEFVTAETGWPAHCPEYQDTVDL